MSKILVFTLIGAALLTLTITAASARHGGWAAGPGGVFRQLELDDSQREAVREIMRATREDSTALREQMHQLRQDIANTIKSSGFDEDQVRLMLENRSALMIDLAMVRIKSMASIYETLTPEQKAKADELLAQRMRGGLGQHGWHRHGHRGEPRITPPEDL